MKRFTLMICVVICHLSTSAQYKVDKLDGKCYMTGACITDNISDNILFANIVLWVQQMTENPGLGMFSKLDYSSRHVEIQTEVKVKNVTYISMLKLDVYGGIIKFRVEDIVQHSTIIMSPKMTPLEKLQPLKKPAHKAAIEEYEREESYLLQGMLDFVQTHQIQQLNHWEDIEKGKIVNGMNETECQLAVGRPRIVNENNGEIQWLVNSGMYIFFKEGLVSSIVK